MFDIGIEDFSTPVSSRPSCAPATNWVCDWIVLNMLDQIVPCCDSAMYKIYATQLNIDIDNFEEKDFSELANAYKSPLIIFQFNHIKSRVYTILNRWIHFVDGDCVLPRLPANAKRALINFLTIIKNTTGTDLTPAFMNFYATLAEAHTSRTTHTFDAPEVFELISKDQFHVYTDLVKKIIDDVFDCINNPDAATKFVVEFKAVKAAMRSILWMCDTHCMSDGYELDTLYDKVLTKEINATPSIANALIKYNTRRSLPLIFGLLICPDTVNTLPEDNDTYPRTDLYMLATTLLYQSTLRKG